MPVEDVFNPKTKTKVDPKMEKEKSESEGPGYWDNKSKEARAKREYEEEERQARIAREKEGIPSPEAPFQVKGSVNLGNIDFQKQQEELKSTIDKIQTDAQTQIQALNQQNNDYRERMHQIQLDMVEKTLKAQIESMQKTLQDGLVKPKDKSITDQISEITQIAGVLGYARPDPQSGLPAELQLKMIEMEMNEKTAARKFEWDKMMSERNWQLELKKLEAESQTRAAEFQQEREKRNMFATPFESIGVAFAKGFLDSGGNISGQRETTKRKRSTHRLQVGEGESGVTECPECGESMAIAPTARSAVCPSCEVTFPITRVSKEV